MRPEDRALRAWLNPAGTEAVRVEYPEGADVLIFQRLTHAHVAAAVPYLRSRGVAIVVDVDDDLAAIHPDNPAFQAFHPSRRALHSWHNLTRACQDATMVTVTTPALAARYGAHGRVRVLPNVLAPHYYHARRVESDWLGWPGTIQSHPNDPQATGGAVGRLVGEGRRFRVIGDPTGAGRLFGLDHDPPGVGNVELGDWAQAIAAGIGVGLAPLAPTRFNAAKSWLKGLEMAACRVPFVASPTPEYERLARMGAGVLAEGNRGWYGQLRRLLDSPDARAEVAERGRLVAEQLSLERHAWRWAEAWADAVAIERAAGPLRPPAKAPPVTRGQLAAMRALARAQARPAAGDLTRRAR